MNNICKSNWDCFSIVVEFNVGFMKSFFLSLFLVLTCFGLMAQVNDSNRHSKRRYHTFNSQISMLNGKPISFYLNHPRIDKISKRFYKGELILVRDSIPACLMDSLFTRNSETRPFYFFLFNQIVDLSDGKMVKSVASKCTTFVQLYPCEFFNSFNQTDIDINVVKWTTYIGLTLMDKPSYFDFKGQVDSKLKTECSDVQDLSKSFFREVRMCLVK
jgi:hypothetical protein